MLGVLMQQLPTPEIISDDTISFIVSNINIGQTMEMYFI